MVNSREKFKDHFLKVYLIWAVITPITMILVQSYIFKADNQGIFEAIEWSRVPALLAIFGLIWPLTIVISPAFYQSFAKETTYSFFEALLNLGDPLATKMIIATLFFIIAWIGPIVHFVIELLKHKNYVSSQTDKPVSWMDYVAGFL